MAKGMGGHQSHRMITDEWLTPPEILNRLGEFDLDPCATIDPPFKTANSVYTRADDGLSHEWFGRVWLNPPYGQQTEQWLKRLADHGNGIALIFARTETAMFVRQVWSRADAVFFFFGRLFFYHVNGTMAKCNAGAPSVLVAYGENNIASIQSASLNGRIVLL